MAPCAWICIMFWVLFECRITPLHTISSLATDFHLGPESQFHPVCVSNYEKQNKPVGKGKSVYNVHHTMCVFYREVTKDQVLYFASFKNNNHRHLRLLQYLLDSKQWNIATLQQHNEKCNRINIHSYLERFLPM